MKLYELTGNFNEIFNMLESEDELNYDALEDTLQALEGAIEHKVTGVAKMLKSLEKHQEAFKSEAQRLAGKARTTGDKIGWLKNYLLETLQATAKDKIMTDIGTVSRRKSPPSVNVVDIQKIPKSYFFTPPPPAPTLDKRGVLEDLKAGAVIPGVELHQGYHIRIQ